MFEIDFILTIACLYIAYSHQQIVTLIHFSIVLVLVFLSFFSINDIYLISWFIAIIYSGAIVIFLIIVLFILDVNIFNLRNNFIITYLFINQQLYNCFTFLFYILVNSYLIHTRKVSIYYKSYMLTLFEFYFIIVYYDLVLSLIDLLLLYFISIDWWSFLEIPLNDYSMQVVAKMFYLDVNGLLYCIVFVFWSILYWLCTFTSKWSCINLI